MINLEQFKTVEEIGFYKNIPISCLSEVREHFRKEGVNVTGMNVMCVNVIVQEIEDVAENNDDEADIEDDRK